MKGEEVRSGMIAPGEVAFDIDGVVIDTMTMFVRLAHERYGFTWLKREDLRHYELYPSLDLPRETVDELICLTLDDDHTRQVPPVEGALPVLTELARHGPLRFVTARIWPESIIAWLQKALPEVPAAGIEVYATGRPEAKSKLLRDLAVQYFVDDRLETCWLLAAAGLQPLLFDQPWNRSQQILPFPRVANWHQLSMRLMI